MSPPPYVCVALLAYFSLCIQPTDAQTSLTQSDMNEIAKGMRKICLSRHKISEEMANYPSQGIFPDDSDFKCYVACLMDLTQT
uniref:Uncharacterized protein n=1 Tax=Anopheles stephensi TaxID=30069 RepID=A0A182YT09_ANOST